MRITLTLAIFTIVGSFQVHARSLDQGEAICYEIESATNALADFTQTKCLPSSGKAGTLSFILISNAPVFSVETSKKAWLIAAVAAVGKALNSRPRVKADELWFSDVRSMKSYVGYVLPASLAKSLQRNVYSGGIALDGMYSSIQNGLVQKNITRK